MKKSLSLLFLAAAAGVAAQTALKPGSYTLSPGAYNLSVPAPAPAPTPTPPAPPPAPTPPAPPPSSGIPQSAILAQMNAQIPNAQQAAHQVQVCGNYPVLNAIPDTTGVVCGTVPINGTMARFVKVPDPTNPARLVYQLGVAAGDPTNAGSPRVDFQYLGASPAKLKPYWVAAEVMVPSIMQQSHDNTTIMALHTGSNTAPSGNWEYQLNSGVFMIAQTNNNGTTWYKITQMSFDVFHKLIFKFLLDPNGNQGGFTEAWLDGTLIWSYTGANTLTAAGDYGKSGFYNFQFTGSGTPPSPRWDFWRSYYMVQDNGYTLAQVQALQQ